MRVRVYVVSEATGRVEVELTDERSPRTFRALLEALPIESRAMRWGDELYFEVPVDVPEENAVDVVEKGAVAYWPPGRCLCVFWGPTPASKEPGEIRPASPVNIVGRVVGDPTVFNRVRPGDLVRVERAP